MRLLGQVKAGDHQGAWAHVAEFDAHVIDTLRPADSDIIREACASYAALILVNREGRTLWRWGGEALLLVPGEG